jgi:hypothetical protein
MHFATHVAHCINLKRSNLNFLIDPRVVKEDASTSVMQGVEGKVGAVGLEISFIY